MRISFDPAGRPPRSLAARVVAAVLGVFVFGAAMMFSVFVFVGLVLVGLAFWAYFWWKTRTLRRTMREEMRARGFGTPAEGRRNQAGGANVIEGEAVRVMDEDRLATTENAEKTESE